MSNPSGSAESRRHPQVLHIGFSKCASTYLRAVFRSQPAVHMVFKSGFFTPFLRRNMSFADYQALFRDEHGIINVESDEHLTLPGVHPDLGVRTTSLKQVEEVADEIRKYLPDVRILMVIRNQASLIVSRYSEYLITGGSLGFEDFADRLAGGENAHYQNRYSRILEILESRFPPDHLLVLLQEDMRRSPARTQAAIAGLLGLDRLAEAQKGLRSERRSLSRAGMRILRAINRLFVVRSSVGGAPPVTRIPLRLHQFLVKVVRGTDFYLLSRLSRGAETLLSDGRRREILARFREDNMRLQARLGVDLAGLGYFEDGAPSSRP
jgi:hypothetical protein